MRRSLRPVPEWECFGVKLVFLKSFAADTAGLKPIGSEFTNPDAATKLPPSKLGLKPLKNDGLMPD
jgi:hypothetical protein